MAVKQRWLSLYEERFNILKNCAYCGKKLLKRQRRFCCRKHSDAWWNRKRGTPTSKCFHVESYDYWNFDDMEGNFSNEDN